MSLILLVFGILITGAGVVAIALGVPAGDSALGQTWIMTGALAAVGGPMLIGFGAVVTQLNAIVEALRVRPAAHIPRLTDARQPPEVQRRPEAVEARPPDPRPPEPRAPEPPPVEPAAPAAAIDVSGSALGRLRSSMARPDRVVTNVEDVPLSPNGNGNGHHAEPKPMQKSEPEVRPGASTEPRLDFLFRPKAPRPAHSEPFDAMWPKRRGPADQPKPDEVARQSPSSSSGGELRPPEREPRSVAILKSGVVDGMAYTLYADGSIEAQLPHGTVRFGSIAELRAHIENNS
jgi:hypothetical protein